MDILVISDSHGHGDRIEELLGRPGVKPEAVFFLGDGLRDMAWCDFHGAERYLLKGNCDIFCPDDAKNEICCELSGVRYFATHGDGYSVKSGYECLAVRAAALGADVVLFGHTHTPLSLTLTAGTVVDGIKLSKNLHLLNPGSIGCSREPSFGTVTVRGGQILTSFCGYI